MTTFVVPGRIVPWKRAQRSASGHTYTDQTRIAYRCVIQAAARAAGMPLLTGPVSLTLRIYVSDGRRFDADNALKIYMDALNGIAYVDDSQVREWYGGTMKCDSDGPFVACYVKEATGTHSEPLGKPKRTRAKKSPSARAAALALERDLLSQPSMTAADRRKLAAARAVVDSEPSRKVAAARQYVGVADAGLTPTQVSRALGLPDARASKRRTT